MRLLRVRWSAAGKAAVAIAAAVLGLRAVPILLRPPEPPPLARDVGLPRPAPERDRPLSRRARQKPIVVELGEARVVVRPTRKHESQHPETVVAPASAERPAPAPAVPPPAPKPASSSPPPSDGSVEFAPH